MKVLVVNCGSSSVKYSLFEMENEERIAWGLVECIGLVKSYYKRQTTNTKEKVNIVKVTNHVEAIELVIEELLAKEVGIITNTDEISVIGHRIVHGGDKFSKSVLVTEEIKKCLKDCFSMAPLHNPANYAGIIAAERMLPGVPSALVFDTAFYQTMPDYAYMYALPYEFYEKDRIRKYGFHGTSHNYVSKRAAIMFNKHLNELNLITVHLGNGSSVTAIEKGMAIDTSMGFTPLQGVVMGTRCGDIDPAIIDYLLKVYPQYRDGNNLNDLINKKSGLVGISGISGDMRTIIQAASNGNERAKLAFKMLCYSVKKYIGAYYGILNGVDGLVFTAGIGENSVSVREEICANLDIFGINMDFKKNAKCSNEERFISTQNSKVKIMVIPTNEELMIARESKEILIGS